MRKLSEQGCIRFLRRIACAAHLLISNGESTMNNLVGRFRHSSIGRLLLAQLRSRMPGRRERSQTLDLVWRNLCGNLREDPVCRLNDTELTFAMDVRSHLFLRILQSGSYEPELFSLVKSKLPLDVDAIDVGANIGFYSCFMAKLPGTRRVLAVEPALNALQRLDKNILRNQVAGQVLVFRGVCSNISGTVALSYIEGKEEYSSLGEVVHPSAADMQRQEVLVQSSTLDDLVAKHGLRPGFIKIDTEGGEANVLKGAMNVLRDFRPIVLSELADPLLKAQGSCCEEVIDHLRSLDYQVVDPMSPGVPVGKRKFGDILAVPGR